MAPYLTDNDCEIPGKDLMIHVFDLPQLYTQPSAESLIQALGLMSLSPRSWDPGDDLSVPEIPQVNPEGVTHYLTSIIASHLRWVASEELRERIWVLAAQRLAERSGRTGMSAITRSFRIPLSCTRLDDLPHTIDIILHEPALTSDNLGLKTWAASYLLSRRLSTFCLPPLTDSHPRRILELGAGTGLLGLSASAVFAPCNVHLTDLPEIVPNLLHNISVNAPVISEYVTKNLDNNQVTGSTSITAGVLDWTNDTVIPVNDKDGYDIVIAADPLYSPEHPRLLVKMVARWLKSSKRARVIVELPIREAYLHELEEMKTRMHGIGLKLLQDGEESGRDDWGSNGTEDVGFVRCWWGIWGRES